MKYRDLGIRLRRICCVRPSADPPVVGCRTKSDSLLVEQLEAAGWYRVKRRAAATASTHADYDHTITVPVSNLGRDVPFGTQKAIEKQARLK